VAGERSIPSDPLLPALGELFPAEGAPQFVADAVSELTGRRVDAAAARVSYVRYRPGKSCVLLWSWENGAGEPLHISGRLFHNERGDRLLAKEGNRRLIDAAAALLGGDNAPYRYFPEEKLLLQVFPLDLRLPELVLAADETWLSERLATNGWRPQLRSVSAKPVSYKPWRRCVYRYDVDTAGEHKSYYAKLFRDDRGEELLGWHRAVNSALVEAQAPWTIPTAAGYFPEAHMLLFDAFDDVVKVRSLLRPSLKDAQAKTTLLRHIAAAAEGLVAFQRSPLADLPSQSPQELIATFREHSEGMEAVAPELQQATTRVLQQLEAAASALSPERLVPTHGAFRHDQLLDAGGGLVVLDLDTICSSGESADAGNFLGYLDLTAVRRPRLKPVIDDCTRTFVETLRTVGLTSPEWVAWYRAAAHVKKALRSFFALQPNWPETVDRMLSLAEATLHDGSGA
jgi:hypothetical protein